MTAGMIYASAESPTRLDRYRSHIGHLGSSSQDPSVGSPGINPDWQLLEALRRRDATAAEHLFSAFGDRAHRLAVSITGNQQDVSRPPNEIYPLPMASARRRPKA